MTRCKNDLGADFSIPGPIVLIKTEDLAVSWIEQILLGFMLLDIGREKRADWNDLKAAFSGRSKREPNERRTDALSFVRGRDLGVRENDLAVPKIVIGDRH